MFSRDEAFVSYVVSGERVFGFVSSRGRLRVRQLAWSTAQLGEAVTRLREQVGDPPRRTDPDAWMRGAAALHDVLLGPFADELQRPDLHALFVSPDGAVAGVPFAALLEPHDGRRRPLIDRLVISYLPSATVYRGLMERRILEEPPRILAVADAVYPSTVHALPMAAEEGQVVSELFPDSLLLTGASATEAEVLARAPAYNILHFATHGLPGAGDASSLLLTQAGADDGLLSAAEVSALDLSHVYLAVLSACGSAVISQSDGSGLGSVVGAFVVAGVPSVVGSLWAIQERASTDLMVELYRRYLDHGAARALRAAMLKTRAVPGLSHPYYWAAFVAYGWDK
jgi:CHAT domain-containing protein